MTDQINIIAEQDSCTVVTHYEAPERDDSQYQSEAQLEAWLIKALQDQGYEYPSIKNEAELMDNLRRQLELANDYTFSNSEWKSFVDNITNEALTMEDKAELIQKDNTAISLTRDNGEVKNIHLVYKDNIHKNRLQVINQYSPPTPQGGVKGNAPVHKNRYDVTILVNGLPLVHIELKRRGVSIKEAFNQINRYQRESFWAGKGMFDYIQIFVISNGTETKYYSNTTRYAREAEEATQRPAKKKIESNSFEFTSYWSDARNKLIVDLEDFAKTFLNKRTLLNILTKYCVFTVDKNLMVMRPYQIAATERIILRIKTALNNRWQGTKQAGGYIWHTTGSGKTLTSFKTAQLAKKIEGVDKVLFVVDRQDLDYQTMKEYDKFEPNCANGNANSAILLKQLNDSSSKIIITTIQKLAVLLKKNKIEKDVLGKNIVFIFDECHRSQFGDMQKSIRKNFSKYMMFGFTGTPIFAVNANKYGGDVSTTAQVFGGELDEKGNHTKALHTYTIINAINDKNVLKFNVEYKYHVQEKNGEKVEITDYDNPERIKKNVEYLLKRFDQKTKRKDTYTMTKLVNVDEIVKNFKRSKDNQKEEQKAKVTVKGFNAMLACQSVPMAIEYYKELEKQMAQPGAKKLKIATIFTCGANEAEEEGTGNIEEDPVKVVELDATSKDFLDSCIQKYNKEFGTSYDTSADKFQNYYKDLSLRVKNRDIDLIIVVGMFLTGFDAKGLNTLWVDKNLKLHGLLQAYSRTNRILNAVKNCGNIVCFRNLEQNTNDSFALFGDENANGIIIMRPFEDYYNGYDEGEKHYVGYKEIVEELLEKFPLKDMQNIMIDDEKKEFIKLFGHYLRAFNLLLAFDQFNPDDAEEFKNVRILTEGQRQDYTSWYLKFRDDLSGEGGEGGGGGNGEGTPEDVEFEMDIIKQVQIDIPYILALVKKYHDSNCQDFEILMEITRSITSSPSLRDKKEIIEDYIKTIRTEDEVDVYEEWQNFVDKRKYLDLKQIIKEENLKEKETLEFVDAAFEQGYVEENGLAVTQILPPMPIFGGGNIRERKKAGVLAKLKDFLRKYLDLGGRKMTDYDETKLKSVEADENVAHFVQSMVMLEKKLPLLKLVAECQKEFGEKYATMDTKDWMAITRDYAKEHTMHYVINNEEMVGMMAAEPGFGE